MERQTPQKCVRPVTEVCVRLHPLRAEKFPLHFPSPALPPSPPSPLRSISSPSLGSMLFWLSVIASNAFFPLFIVRAVILSHSRAAVGHAGASRLRPLNSYHYPSAGNASGSTSLARRVRWRLKDSIQTFFSFSSTPLETFSSHSCPPFEVWFRSNLWGFDWHWRKVSRSEGLLVALNCNVWIHHRGLSGLRTNHAGIVKSLCAYRLIILWVLLPFMEPMVFFT